MMSYYVLIIIFYFLFFSVCYSQPIDLKPRLVRCAYAGYIQGITVFYENSIHDTYNESNIAQKHSHAVGLKLICSRDDLIIEGKGIVNENYVFGKKTDANFSRICEGADAVNWIYDDFIPACYPYQSNRENLTTSINNLYIPPPDIFFDNFSNNANFDFNTTTTNNLAWGDQSCDMSGQPKNETVYKLLRTALVTFTENSTLYNIMPQFCRDVYPRDVREVEGCGLYKDDNYPGDEYNVDNPSNGNMICKGVDGWRDGLCQGYENDYCKKILTDGSRDEWYTCSTSTRTTGGKDMYPSNHFFVEAYVKNHEKQCEDYDDLQTTTWFQILNGTENLCMEVLKGEIVLRNCSVGNKNFGQYFTALFKEEKNGWFFALETGLLPGLCVSKLNELVFCDTADDIWYQSNNNPDQFFDDEEQQFPSKTKIINPLNWTEEIDYFRAFLSGFHKGFQKLLEEDGHWVGWNITYMQQVHASVPLSYRATFERPEWCDWRQLWCNHENRIILMQPTEWDSSNLKLDGNLTNDIFKLPRLQGMAIQSAGVQSTLPHLGDVTKLFQSQNRKSDIRYLDFQNNIFFGVLPSDWGWQNWGQDGYNFFSKLVILLLHNNKNLGGGLPQPWVVPKVPFTTDAVAETTWVQMENTRICFNRGSPRVYAGISTCFLNTFPDQEYAFVVKGKTKFCVDCGTLFDSPYNVSTAIQDVLGDVVKWQTVKVECRQEIQCGENDSLKGRKLLQTDMLNSTVELLVTGNGTRNQEDTIKQRLQYNLPKIFNEQISEAVVMTQDEISVQKQQDSGLSTGAIIGITVAILVAIIITIVIIVTVTAKKRQNFKNLQKLDISQTLQLPDLIANEDLPRMNEGTIDSIISEIDKKWGSPQTYFDKSKISDSDAVVINFVQTPSSQNVKLEITPASSLKQGESSSQFLSMNNTDAVPNLSDDLPYEQIQDMFVVPENIEPNSEQQLFYNQLQLITRFTPAQRDVDLEIDVDRDLELISEIGYGAFGTVHKAVWTKKSGEKMDVAVKFMNPGLAAELSGKENKQHLKNFREELVLMCKMRHPNVVKCFGGCLKPPRLAIVLEFMEGGNLHNYIHKVREVKKLSSDEVLRITAHIAAGLNYLHPSILHRDLKPKNVLLDRNGVPKISDFGLSKIRNQTMSMTVNQIKGTPQYIAPEVWTGQLIVTEKCDIYSLGIIAWEMITGERPWHQCSTYMQILGLVSVFKKRPDIPQHCDPFLKELIQDCWDHDEKRRPAAGQIHRQILWYYQKENKNQQQ